MILSEQCPQDSGPKQHMENSELLSDVEPYLLPKMKGSELPFKPSEPQICLSNSSAKQSLS